MNIELHYFHSGVHFLMQLFLQQRNYNRISGQDDGTYFVFADNLRQAFHDLFGVLRVRVPHAPLVAGLRPSTDFYPMNLLAFHLLRGDHMVQPEDEDTRRVHIRKHGGIARILLIDMGQMVQQRLFVGVDAVVADRSG